MLEAPIDLNRAPLEALRSLEHIGDRLARRIQAGRPYDSPEALLRVRGLGPKLFERNRSRLRVR
jgi:DNA uptake protein ComE-like DNA-binding protein